MIRETAGRVLFELQTQAEVIALICRDEGACQCDRRTGRARVQFNRPVAIAIPADHINIDITHHLCARQFEIAGVRLAAPHPLLLAREMDEANGVCEALGPEDLNQRQRRRSAGGVVVGAGSEAERRVRRAVEVTADQPDALRMNNARQVDDDVPPAVGAVGPWDGARRQAERCVMLPHIRFGVGNRRGKGVAGGDRDIRTLDERSPSAAQVSDQVVDARFAYLRQQRLNDGIGGRTHHGGSRRISLVACHDRVGVQQGDRNAGGRQCVDQSRLVGLLRRQQQLKWIAVDDRAEVLSQAAGFPCGCVDEVVNLAARVSIEHTKVDAERCNLIGGCRVTAGDEAIRRMIEESRMDGDGQSRQQPGLTRIWTEQVEHRPESRSAGRSRDGLRGVRLGDQQNQDDGADEGQHAMPPGRTSHFVPPQGWPKAAAIRPEAAWINPIAL